MAQFSIYWVEAKWQQGHTTCEYLPICDPVSHGM